MARADVSIYINWVRSFNALPQKEFLGKIGKSVRLPRYSYYGKLGMYSKLSAPGSRKVGKIMKNDITCGLISKTRKRVLLTL